MNLDGPFLVELVKNYIDQNHSDVFGKRNKDYEVYVSKALDPIKVKRL